MKKQDKKVTYVVARKGKPNSRPGNVKGRYKMVDRRLKKDKRAKERQEQKKVKSRHKAHKPGKAKKQPKARV